LLERCFSKLEWQFLTHDPDFQNEWQGNCKTLDDVERLSLLGHKLITERDAGNPDTPLGSVRPRSGKPR
jgi:hypothetical protein